MSEPENKEQPEVKDLPFKELAPAGPPTPVPGAISKSMGKRATKAHPGSSKKENPFKRSVQQAKQKRVVLAIAAALLMVVGLGYYFYSAGRATIIIQDTSSDLKISLNSQPVKLNKQKEGYVISTFAGKYRIQITKPNYLTYVQDVQVDRGQTLSIRPAFAFQPTSKQAENATVDYVRPSLDGKSIFYLGENRKTIYRMEIANQVKIALTDEPLKAVTDVQWSSEPNVALITQSDGVYLREIPKFDYENQTLVKLGGNELVSPVWDPLNPNRIALGYFPSTGERSLVFTDKRLSYMDRKADITDIANPKIIWSPNDQYVLLIGRSTDYAKNNIWIYTTSDGSLRQITDGGNVVDASFSPNSETILYENYTADPGNRFGSTLSVMKSDGSEKKPLNISGKVARSAWKDDTSFYLPSDNNSLILYNDKGNPDRVSFNFPDDLSIQGMEYFPTSKTLIFYTSDSIYTVALAI